MRRFSSALLSTALLISVFLSATGGLGQEKSVPSTSSNDEYQVYAAVLESLQRSGKVSHPLIADQTSTFACHGIGICNGFVMGGCNGLLGPDESPESRMRIVRRDLPALEAKTTSDFVTLNQKCSVVHDKIPLSSKYYMFNPSNGPKLPKEWEHPDLVYLSRASINSARTQALVYVGVMSGTNAKDSTGFYILLLRQKGQWTIKNSSAAWALVPTE